MARTILITGGSGYLGGRLAAALTSTRSADIRTIVASRRPDGVLSPADCVSAVNWRSSENLDHLCRDVDAVVHLAALNEAGCRADPARAVHDNGVMTLALLDAARRSGVRRFLYLSTVKVYGRRAVGVVTEETPTRPETHYAISHRLAEDYVLAAHDQGALLGAALRLSNGMGPPIDPRIDCWGVIGNDFCRQAAQSNRIVLQSSGMQWRNFMALADVVRALIHCLDMPETAFGDGVFNLGGPRSCRLWELAERVAERCARTLGRRPEIVRPPPQDPNEGAEGLNYRCDRLHATGWRHETSLEVEIDAALAMCAK